MKEKKLLKRYLDDFWGDVRTQSMLIDDTEQTAKIKLDHFGECVKDFEARINKDWLKPYFKRKIQDDIHKALTTSEIYDKLRESHSILKDILYAENFGELTEEKKNAIEALHGVMYLAEKEFTNF